MTVAAKTCPACKESKPLTEFGWRCIGTPKERQEARCKPCRSKANNTFNRRKRLEKDTKLVEASTESPCPCEACWKQNDCQVECLSFRCWSEYGV